jgi:serine protease
MARTILALVCLIAAASAIAPLFKQERIVVKDGLLSYIVVFNEFAPEMRKELQVQAYLEVEGISGVTVNNVYLIRASEESAFRGFAAYLTSTQLQKIRSHAHVSYVEEDQIIEVNPIYENATVPYYGRGGLGDGVAAPASDWGQDRMDQHCLPLNGQFTPCTSSAIDCQGAGAAIWIVDTGIRTTHTDFGGRASIAADYASGDPKPYNGDCNGHGTHCAGSAAGTTWGIANKANLYSVRVLNCQGSGTNANVISGFDYVGNNQKSGKRNIMSASLGGSFSQSTNDAVEKIIAKGVICVVAAGNDNANACNYSPASAPNAITVGATTSTDARSSFSNFGTCVDTFAPGSSIKSAWYTSDTATNTLSGTSMATPLVAGAIALQQGQPSNSKAKTDFTGYATKNVVGNAGTGSPNRLGYDRGYDGTSTAC